MTVVATLSSTWPSVRSERTSLLDPACGPKQTDGSTVLFEFKVDSCGTRNVVRKRHLEPLETVEWLPLFCFVTENHLQVGDAYMVYENEILHNRQLIPDGPNFISRDSSFK